MKRILSVFLSFILMCSFTFSAFAENIIIDNVAQSLSLDSDTVFYTNETSIEPGDLKIFSIIPTKTQYYHYSLQTSSSNINLTFVIYNANKIVKNDDILHSNNAGAIVYNKTINTSAQSDFVEGLIYLNANNKYYITVIEKANTEPIVPTIIENTFSFYPHTHSFVTKTENGKKYDYCKVCNTKNYYQKISKYSLTSNFFVYSGKAKRPNVIVKDAKGNVISSSYYTINYSNKNSKNVGKYSVKVTMNKYPYTGSKTLYYTILPKSTSLNKLYKYRKSFKVTWKKATGQFTGYQIQYSTSNKFTSKTTKSVKISNKKTTSKTFKKLKSKKTYYVRVRTYKTVKINGKNQNIYSKWSKSKSIKTK